MLDLSAFPSRMAAIMEFSGRTSRFVLRNQNERDLDLAEVTSVWWRRPQHFVLPEEMTDPASRRFALSEAETAFQGLFQSLRAHWVNVPNHDLAADHKPWQLTLAQRLGLTVPLTLMTNDPKAAVAFWRAHPGEVVHKQFIALPDSWRETRRLLPEDLELAETIGHAPVIFQRNVDAVADLRVILIGNNVYAAAADLRDMDYPQDVRLNRNIRYTAHQLPETVVKQLQALMRELKLIYGAVDLRLTPAGDYVFLEINPAGQFLYIEEQTGQPIAEALAAQLAVGSSTI